MELGTGIALISVVLPVAGLATKGILWVVRSPIESKLAQHIAEDALVHQQLRDDSTHIRTQVDHLVNHLLSDGK